MRELEPRGKVEIWNITDHTKDGMAIVGYTFWSDEKGVTQKNAGDIWIHSRQPAPEVLDTLVHECTHSNYPEYNEREVLEWTKAEMSELTVDSMIHYIEVLENARGWWRIRHKMGKWVMANWGKGENHEENILGH
jgi:hypothetical protein